MSYSIYAYLTDASKIKAVYCSKDKYLFNELYESLQGKLDELDKSFFDQINKKKNSYEILKDIVNGKIRFEEISFMYGYIYEIICEYYGRLIYNNRYIWQLDNQSTFIPIPLSKNFPYIISIEFDLLYDKKKQYILLRERQGIGDYEEEIKDLEFIFDEALERKMDLLISIY